jgi:hypothetical protein
MDVMASDHSGRVPGLTDLRLQRPAPHPPSARARLRALSLAVALFASAALLSGPIRARGAHVAGAPLAHLPVVLLPGHGAALASISISCPKDITANASAGNCAASVSFEATATPGSGCKLLGIAYAIGSTQITSPHTFPVGTTTVTAGAADSCGGTATCEFHVTVRDTQPPSITCPSSGSVNADTSHCNANVGWAAATAADNCSVASLKYYIGSTEITTPHVFPVGTTTITAEARDPSGNSASCTFQITVRDVTPPTIICPASISTTASSGLCSAVASYVTTASDACALTLACAPASGSSFPVGSTNVTCQAIDASNNTASCMFAVTVRDTQPPSVTCPANMTVSTDAGRCDASVTMGALGSDNCTLASLHYLVNGRQISNPNTFSVGKTSVQVEVRDPAGNVSTCTFWVMVNDTEPPKISCPADLNLNAPSGRCSASAPFTATVSDNCTVASVKYYDGAAEISSPHDFAVGTTTVRAEVMDASANTASCTFHVRVREAVPPSITCPADMDAAAANDLCSASLAFSAPASDNCGLASLHYYLGVTSTTQISSPYSFPVGVTGVRAEARDASDNAAACLFHATVRDTQPPGISCPPDITVDADPGRCDARVTMTARVTDNCSVDSLRYFWGSTEISNPFTFSLGTTTVRAEARDAAGNVATCSFHVTVRDAQPPGVTCPPDKTVNTDAGRCSATVPFTATATDNCGVAWLRYYTGTLEIHSPYTFPLGTSSVRAVASDSNNNAECTFHVSVRDGQGPSIACPPTVHTTPDPGMAYASHVTVGTATAADNCAVPTVRGVRADGKGLAEPYPLGRTVITWTALDAAGNPNSCTQDVWVAAGASKLYLPCLLKH